MTASDLAQTCADTASSSPAPHALAGQSGGVPLTVLDPVGRSIGNQSFRARRRLAGVPMQTYLDCGGSSGQPNAETYDISLSLLSYVAVDGKNVTLVTRIFRVEVSKGLMMVRPMVDLPQPDSPTRLRVSP